MRLSNRSARFWDVARRRRVASRLEDVQAGSKPVSAGVREASEAAARVVAAHGGSGFAWADSEAERKQLWHARSHAYWASIALKPGARGFPTDMCVPVTKLPKCILKCKALAVEHELLAPMVGHVGDGNFHMMLIVDPENTGTHAILCRSPALPRAQRLLHYRTLVCGVSRALPGAPQCEVCVEWQRLRAQLQERCARERDVCNRLWYACAEEVRRAERVVGEMVDIAHSLGGTCTGEHGVGYGKLKHMLAEHGSTGLEVRESAGNRCKFVAYPGCTCSRMLQGVSLLAVPAACFQCATHVCIHRAAVSQGWTCLRAFAYRTCLLCAQVMHAIKQALDPLDIMNPGKLGSSSTFAAAA